jgi:hypothetical protein
MCGASLRDTLLLADALLCGVSLSGTFLLAGASNIFLNILDIEWHRIATCFCCCCCCFCCCRCCWKRQLAETQV